MKNDARSNSISMNSVGKVLYESVQRDTDLTRNNLVYCPSPYATTRVSLFFPPNGNNGNPDLVAAAAANGLSLSSHGASRGDIASSLMQEQNCYDMPLIKQVNLQHVPQRLPRPLTPGALSPSLSINELVN